MADIIWVYAEVIDDKITPTTLEMLTKAAELSTAETVLLGPAPEDAVSTLAQYGATKVLRSPDAVFRAYGSDRFHQLGRLESVGKRHHDMNAVLDEGAHASQSLHIL